MGPDAELNQPLPISTVQLDQTVSDVLRRVYGLMMVGLLVTAGVGWYVSGSEAVLTWITSSQLTFYGVLLAPIVLVLLFSASVWRVSPAVGLAIFLVYAAVTGLTFAFLFLIYTEASMALTFGVTAGMFGAMCIVGYTTRTDLSRYGSLFLMGLIGLILASLANWWLQSDAFGWVLTYLGIALFLGLTAYDTQRIKQHTVHLLLQGQGEVMLNRLAVSGALSLYLDFINLFLRLLSIFGRRR